MSIAERLDDGAAILECDRAYLRDAGLMREAAAEIRRLEVKLAEHRTELHRKLGAITWHKCSDQLPDDESAVLLAFDDGEVWTGFRDGADWRYLSADLIEGGVTHWAHLPAHPEEEGS